MSPFLKKHGIEDDLQEFARFMFQGKLTFGRPEEYNAKWKKFAQENPQLKIQCKKNLTDFFFMILIIYKSYDNSSHFFLS